MKYEIKKRNPVIGIKKIDVDRDMKTDSIDQIVKNICKISDKTKAHPISKMEIKKRRKIGYDYD